MILDDTFFLSEEMGEIRPTIDDNGMSRVWCAIDKHVECYILIRSLDTDLSVNAMGVCCSVGSNVWTHGEPFFLTNKMENSHGLKVEIYDLRGVKKFHEKCYHRTKKYRGIKLRSNSASFAYQSYHTFFNDTFFLDNFNVRDGDVVYDLGANIGAFSLACSNYDVKKIYAFEPHFETFSYLKYNLEVYGKNATCLNKAIGKDTRKAVFGGSSTVCSLGYQIDPVSANFKEEVDCVNLEEFVLRNSYELPTYLKLDIEGSEYDFFDSTSDSFFKNTHTVFLEFHNNDGKKLNKILERMSSLGYEKVHQKPIDVPQETVYLVK